jgi:hypothetical protein
MKIAVSIMAHPKRLKYIPYLIKKLGDVPIVIDLKNDIWDTRKRAMQICDRSANYVLVIQDDAIIGKDFYKNVEKEIREHPGNAYSFYFGNRKKLLEKAKKAEKQNGILMGWVSWGVAICLPMNIIDDLMQWCDKNIHLRYRKHDDTMIAKYLCAKRINTWYPIPSLVDHRTEERSLVDSQVGGGRRAYKFIGE